MKTIRGIRNNNPMNIRKGNNWRGERPFQSDKEFEEFESMEMGLRAGLKLIKNYQTKPLLQANKANTIRKIINRWAPPTENNTSSYIKTVSKRTGLLPDEVIPWTDKAKIIALAEAMCFVECGACIDPEIISSAYDLV